MASNRSSVLIILLMLTLSACGTTRRFVDQPPVTVEGADISPHRAAADLFDADTPYIVTLCEADPASRDCKTGSTGISANGVGGLFLPLVLKVSAMTVSSKKSSDDGWAIDAAVQSKADAIPPVCRTAHGQILLRRNDTVTVRLRNFYCNWVVVGNVIVNADFSIDHIDARNHVFNGFYKLSFHGTGNAAGSGYYKAVVRPESPRVAARD